MRGYNICFDRDNKLSLNYPRMYINTLLQNVVVKCILERASMSGHTQISLRLSRITMNQEVQGLFNYHYYTKYLDKTV